MQPAPKQKPPPPPQQGKRPWVKKKRGLDLSPLDRLQHAVRYLLCVMRTDS